LKYCFDRNIRLSDWVKYKDEEVQNKRVTGGSAFNSMANIKTEKIAQQVVTQLSHDAVVDLLVLEWEELPGALRMCISQRCNEANVSGNVRKNIQRLNQKLNGKLLKEKEAFEASTNVRVEGPNGVKYVKKVISGSEAGARKKYQLLK
jgi:hypothetical protein